MAVGISRKPKTLWRLGPFSTDRGDAEGGDDLVTRRSGIGIAGEAIRGLDGGLAAAAAQGEARTSLEPIEDANAVSARG